VKQHRKAKGGGCVRNPNGYGSVVHLKGNRRRPFVVRKTKEWNKDTGYPVYEIIGYYPTREAGMIALAQYNNDPWDVDREKTTMEGLFQLWCEKKLPKLGTASQGSLKSAYTHCKQLHKTKYKAIRAFNMQECVDGCGKGYSTQGQIKNLFGHLDRFALELDIINRCYSDLVTSASIPETSKIPFSDDEVSRLWRISSDEWVDSVLFFLYTGFRISEFLDLRIDSVDLEAGIIRGGTKTKAGKDRAVPIHSKLREIVLKRISECGEYLFSYDGNKCTMKQYYGIWRRIMKKLGMNHTPHECRHTFRSRLDSAGANKRCIDLIMGHKSKDVGERVYTHKTVQELKDTIELITH
jgi:integrase